MLAIASILAISSGVFILKVRRFGVTLISLAAGLVFGLAVDSAV